jgi:hypothetical protein
MGLSHSDSSRSFRPIFETYYLGKITSVTHHSLLNSQLPHQTRKEFYEHNQLNIAGDKKFVYFFLNKPKFTVMGKLTLTELTSKKFNEKLVKTTKAIQGGDTEYCHELAGKFAVPRKGRVIVN